MRSNSKGMIINTPIATSNMPNTLSINLKCSIYI